ncbi:MAG: TrpR-like protein YerC/YecD [Clostridia bacterium]|nr:TrpR-like protein YerC/YecD [Clostridia bacterium]MBR2908532.1 TrpR-like protein YerC/YecD [Clostridia bacterium]
MDFHENEGYRLLVKAILSLENEKDCDAFLEDLLTKKELSDMAQRILVAKRLSEQVVYSKIVEETGASTATISRVNRCYNYGTGGYGATLERIKED